jgi:hypothetical protein
MLLSWHVQTNEYYDSCRKFRFQSFLVLVSNTTAHRRAGLRPNFDDGSFNEERTKWLARAHGKGRPRPAFTKKSGAHTALPNVHPAESLFAHSPLFVFS